jgi:hypothetical protein
MLRFPELVPVPGLFHRTGTWIAGDGEKTKQISISEMRFLRSVIT